MKLRNKKTGEIKSIEVIIREAFLSNELDSLYNLNANWEDTKEPVIKDEKIRKAVRAWSEANGIEFMDIIDDSTIKDCGSNHIEFLGSPFKGLVKKPYYIDDLCGSEE